MDDQANNLNIDKKVVYSTLLGNFYEGFAEDIISSPQFIKLHGQVNLIFTTPPFPLNRKKKYGNVQGDAYISWLSGFADLFKNVLHPKGSIVMEIGNSWEPGQPTMSTLPLRSFLEFLSKGNLHLCEQFIYYNPAKLPSPAQWVNVERIRVKDSFTTIWWMSLSSRPKANNRNILIEYSESMKSLLKKQKYNYGKRPSEHNIGETSFLKNNKGAIPSNVISLANNHANTTYLQFCKERQLQPHPARMPVGLPEFFIKFLTEEGDMVLDPFAGSNTTGSEAEKLGRRWVSIEPKKEYIIGSVGRFQDKSNLLIGDNYSEFKIK
jgi:site-specific DNA-methyltransferase (cytosine-N4-specific)